MGAVPGKTGAGLRFPLQPLSLGIAHTSATNDCTTGLHPAATSAFDIVLPGHTDLDRLPGLLDAAATVKAPGTVDHRLKERLLVLYLHEAGAVLWLALGYRLGLEYTRLVTADVARRWCAVERRAFRTGKLAAVRALVDRVAAVAAVEAELVARTDVRACGWSRRHCVIFFSWGYCNLFVDTVISFKYERREIEVKFLIVYYYYYI